MHLRELKTNKYSERKRTLLCKLFNCKRHSLLEHADARLTSENLSLRLFQQVVRLLEHIMEAVQVPLVLVRDLTCGLGCLV